MEAPKSSLIFNSLADDNTASHEEALLRIYQRLRPGNPAALEKARTLFNDRSFDFITKSPPAAALLKQAAGIAKGSGVPNVDKVATVTIDQIDDICKKKMEGKF